MHTPTQPTQLEDRSDAATHLGDRATHLGDRATHLEDTAIGAPVTALEHGSASGARAHSDGLLSLPEELADDYRPLRQLAESGAEATLYEVMEAATGETLVLKLYHRRDPLPRETLDRIQTIDHAHVVRMTNYGELPDGRWYEVQERIGAGNLVGYRSSGHFSADDIVNIVSQLVEAISAFHEAGLAHHDIKPENMLVRSTSPLDIVLGDFGLSVVSNNRTYYATNHNATVAYQAPETMKGVGGNARDYWALGLTIAMLATGDAPYAGLNEHGIKAQHYEKMPPQIVESMPEGRLRQLCRGLTRYNPKSRWSEHEVRRWLAGENPPVAGESPAQPADPARSVMFNNKRFSTPAVLAREIVACWSLAAEQIGVGHRRQSFMDEILTAFGTEPLARLNERWVAEPPGHRPAPAALPDPTRPTQHQATQWSPGTDIDAAVVDLAHALDARMPAAYAGRNLTADSVAAAALSDSASDREFVADLRDRGILAAWSRFPENSELGAIDGRWREERHRANEIIADAEAAGADAPPIEEWDGMLLTACASRDMLEDLIRERDSSRSSMRHLPSWYRPIAGGSTPAAVVGSVLLKPAADRDQRNVSEVRRGRRLQRLRALPGALAAAMFFGGVGLEFRALNLGFPPMSWRESLPLVALALALFRQWSNSNASAPAGTIGAGDRRRAEAYGIAALASVVYWTLADNLPILPLHLRGIDWSDSMALSRLSIEAFKLAGLLSITWSLLSFLSRRGDGPPTAEQVRLLRALDRSTLERAMWWTATGIVPAGLGAILIVTSLGDNLGVGELGRWFSVPGEHLLETLAFRCLWLPLLGIGVSRLVSRTGGRWAWILVGAGVLAIPMPPSVTAQAVTPTLVVVLRGLWLPLLAGGLTLLVRGRWAHRRAGTVWAVALLTAGCIALPLGQWAVSSLSAAT